MGTTVSMAALGTILPCIRFPPLSQAMDASCPGFLPMASLRSSNPWMALPSISTMRSPETSPARSAGSPGTTVPMVAGLISPIDMRTTK